MYRPACPTHTDDAIPGGRILTLGTGSTVRSGAAPGHSAAPAAPAEMRRFRTDAELGAPEAATPAYGRDARISLASAGRSDQGAVLLANSGTSRKSTQCGHPACRAARLQAKVKFGKKRLRGSGGLMDERAISFGSFRLFAAQRLLLESDKPVRLGSRAFDILTALVETAGGGGSKEELMGRARA